jgi:hypothetical protein
LAHGKSWARFLAAAILAFASSAYAQQLVGVNQGSNDNGSPPRNFGLFYLDGNTGAITDGRVITIPSGIADRAFSIATDPTTGKVYAVVRAPAFAWRRLVTLNIATGAGTEIGNLGDNVSSIAFRSDGQLFGVTGDGASVPSTLYLIDKGNATKVFAASLRRTRSNGEVIAYHPGDDAFYHWSGNGSIVFERISAQAPYAVTGITSGAGGEVFGAVWDPARSLFLVHNNNSQMAFWTTAGVRSSLQAMTLGNVRGMAFLPPPPAVTSIVRAGASPTNAPSVDFTVTFSDAVSGVDASDFAVIAGGTATGTISSVVGSGTTWTVTVGSITGDGTLRLDLVDDDSVTNGTNSLGGPGNANGNFTTGEIYIVDHTAPTVTSVAVPTNGTYTLGQALQFTVTLDDAVIVDTVGGTPFLPLTLGSTARAGAYVSGSNSSTLVFAYTVQPGDVDGDGIALGSALSLNGATIRDAVTNDAVLTLNGVASTTGVLVSAPTYAVTPSAGANGTIAPNTPQVVNSGATTAFTVTPSAGYTASVGGTCGGALAGTTYTTNAITVNCTVAAIFTQVTYTVTPSAGANGSITPATAQTIGSGATTAFTVTPSAGYTASVGGTCGGALAGNTYTTNAITANCTVAATFTQVTYTVTPSAGANGSITPAAPQTIGSGATTTFTVTPSAGYTASVGGTCGGALAGNTYTTNAITANCTVAASFVATAITTYTAPSATGSGTITASFTGGGPACTFATSQFIPLAGRANSPPAGSAPSEIAFPHGLFDFTLSGCTPGATIVMTITYPAALPSSTQYWKYGPMPGSPAAQWYVLPAAIAGNTATFSITDGKLGDDDLTANGMIVDQGGPGIGSQAVRQVPTLSQWALLLIAALMMASGITMGNRRIGK